MFFRMIKGAIFRQWKKMLMIALTIALGTSLATAMLNVMMDVGDKVNQELKTYGANIVVVPQNSSVIEDLYEVEGGNNNTNYLLERELGNIKTIFWAFNITDFTPFINANINVDGKKNVTIVGTWYNHHMELPTGETLDTGITKLRTWWGIVDGRFLDEKLDDINSNNVIVGKTLASDLGLKVGDSMNVSSSKEKDTLNIVGIFDAGDEADNEIYSDLHVVQKLLDAEGYISSIEVSALTTPDNELAIKAAKDPSSLTVKQYETWYCTAYVSSICYQIQEAITDSVAYPVRQVADSEGAILEKTELLMVLITILSLIGSALGITNLVTASVMERSNEIGLLKAIGATNSSISGLILSEVIITGIIGAIVGYFAGILFAQVIGHTVFASSIDIKLYIIPIVAILVIIVTLFGSIPAIRMLLRLKPAEVLHGR